MRLWHYKLIQYLPTKQLVAQWRELNSIFKKQDKHILINYIYNYDKSYLLDYTTRVLDEMHKRSIRLNEHSFDKYNEYFRNVKQKERAIYNEHNDEYLTICVWNLREKYLRGQKDFTYDVWNEIAIYYNNYKNLNIY